MLTVQGGIPEEDLDYDLKINSIPEEHVDTLASECLDDFFIPDLSYDDEENDLFDEEYVGTLLVEMSSGNSQLLKMIPIISPSAAGGGVNVLGLFDTGASRSFCSSGFAEEHASSIEPLASPFWATSVHSRSLIQNAACIKIKIVGNPTFNYMQVWFFILDQFNHSYR